MKNDGYRLTSRWKWIQPMKTRKTIENLSLSLAKDAKYDIQLLFVISFNPWGNSSMKDYTIKKVNGHLQFWRMKHIAMDITCDNLPSLFWSLEVLVQWTIKIIRWKWTWLSESNLQLAECDILSITCSISSRGVSSMSHVKVDFQL